MKSLLFSIIVALFLVPQLHAQEWVIPEDHKGKLADFTFDDDTRKAGEDIFMTNCKSCHGIPGQNNSLALIPSPGDPASEKFQRDSDGTLFYKIREGRGQMASFKKVLSIQQVWQVISFIRSFHPNYTQSVAEKFTGANNRWTDIVIALNAGTTDGKITATVTGKEGDAITPVTGAEVTLMAQRKFGHLSLDEPKITNQEGVAVFNQPSDLPGDTIGMINLIAQLDEEQFGDVTTESSLSVGKPTITVPLTDKRAMWSVVHKAPYWILLSYGLCVLAVWGIIFFVLLQLRSIFKLGEQQEKLKE